MVSPVNLLVVETGLGKLVCGYCVPCFSLVEPRQAFQAAIFPGPVPLTKSRIISPSRLVMVTLWVQQALQPFWHARGKRSTQRE